jgi:hypothetical protein
MSNFAVFYVAAQVIERITELFSMIFDRKYDQTKDAGKIKRRKEHRDSRQTRAIVHWLIASALGIVLTLVFYLGFHANLGLFEASGFSLDPIPDAILTGISLGAGTKPLHDLISYMTKSVDEKST